MRPAGDPIGGQIPANWRVLTVGEVCDKNGGEVQTGPFGSQLHADDYVDDGVPSVMPKDMVGNRISTKSIARVAPVDAERLSVHRLRAGDIVYARRGDIGRRALVSKAEEGWLCGTGCLRIRLNAPDVHPEYVLAYLGHPAVVSYVESKAQGATMLNLNTSILRAVPLRLPPLPEQRRIADILDKADAIRRKRRESIALTEELLRSAFLEVFGDPVTNPKGWRKVSLGDVARITDGTHKTPTYINSGIPFLSAKNIRAHKIDWSQTRFISQAEHSELVKRCYPRFGDVLLTKSGTIGEAAVVDRETEFSLFESVALIQVHDGILQSSFLATLLNDAGVRIHYSAEVKGVAVQHLHLVDIRRLAVTVPPKAEQARFDRCFRLHQSMLAKIAGSAAASNRLFDSLVQRAFNRGLC